MTTQDSKSEMSKSGSDIHSVDIQAPNPGNPVFTCDHRFSNQAPTFVSSPKTQETMSKPHHPMYITSSSSYGALQPTVETTPNSFHGKSQRFSEHLGQSGMYRNHSLNTAKDQHRV